MTISQDNMDKPSTPPIADVAKPSRRRLGWRLRAVLLVAGWVVLSTLWPRNVHADVPSSLLDLSGWFHWLVDSMCNVAVDAGRQVWDWLVTILLSILNTLIGTSLQYLPVPDLSAVNVLAPYVRALNAWVPLDDMCDGLALYFAWRLLWLVVRMVKSFVPTVSN